MIKLRYMSFPLFFEGWDDILGIRSVQGRTADALALGGDEGRGKLRKSPVRRKRPLTRRYPNGTTRQPLAVIHVMLDVEANAGN